MMSRLNCALAIAICLLPLPAVADDVSDALQAAVDAYAAGNLGQTAASLTLASQALAASRAPFWRRFCPRLQKVGRGQ